jgi:hypothetical protein
LNADAIVAVTGQLLTANMFTYCLNNPVNLDDPSGYLAMVEYVVRDDPYYNSALTQRKIRYKPDYYSFRLNIAISNPVTLTLVGWSGHYTIDRFGNHYYSLAGGNIGKSASAVSYSLVAGMIEQPTIPREAEVEQFCKGHSFNIGGGFIGGSGLTRAGDKTGVEFGLFSPQVGGSYSKTTILWDR